MRGRHGQRGWALLALFILLAASVVVDGGIEDCFIQQGAAIDASVCAATWATAALHTDALIWCDCSLWITGLAQNSAPAGRGCFSDLLPDMLKPAFPAKSYLPPTFFWVCFSKFFNLLRKA